MAARAEAAGLPVHKPARRTRTSSPRCARCPECPPVVAYGALNPAAAGHPTQAGSIALLAAAGWRVAAPVQGPCSAGRVTGATTFRFEKA